MPLKTPAEYRESLRDGRETYINGERVPDITLHPWFQQPIEVCAADYIYDDPATRHIRLYETESGTQAHRIFQVPRTEQDLEAWMELPEISGPSTMVTQVLMALWNVKGAVAAIKPEYAENIERLYRLCRDNDLRAAEVITDAKGDRSRRPVDQDDPDLYLRIIDRNKDGIVVRGAKLHITAASMVHELVVMPTKAMSAGEEDYAVSFSVPANTKGVKIINRAWAEPGRSNFDYPMSVHKNAPEGFVIFDDVFVPWDRVLLAGETPLAGVYANSLGLWERVGGLIEFAARARRMVGMAALIAEWNGIAGASHIQEKIAELVFNAEILRMSLENARHNYCTSDTGMVYPDPVAINVGKFYAASTFNNMVRILHDIAGGLVITLPTEADYRNPELHPYLEKYLHTRPGVNVQDRMRLYNLVRDCTADAYGGWELVTTVQAGGGIAAQRIVVMRSFDLEAAKREAKQAAGIV
ncbi:MAG: 4-hydroxyphenylacetate 3-hydroxylase [Dehalococcoidia bacterium]|nr:MAG: 4-hydroxyphenylacetate 3-hydroxylase [bacterium]MCE7927787.1 4-hydroxyphenylacetate 3-hydroxylase [Chloroflexi bacterium CFX7]MCL4231092.1 4-hydroxyphenylacetate 3-hydroxylase [Dehalococcoidia bacterium]NUQ56843.1 4-hydroxyphenylacetate 3-hydroxylase [Dehalococcoidia bacterium]RIL02631.1 MAG: 4-hydroxyphenylacetate 3-hydroxylase [bacterium]